MSELFEKSMATLELPQVLALLADCAGHPGGKERCLALRPLTDLDDVARGAGGDLRRGKDAHSAGGAPASPG